MPLDHRHLQHAPRGRRYGKERRVGGAPLRPERRQDDVHDLVVDLEHRQQRLVEASRLVGLGRRHELVGEAEAVEEGAQHGVVVVREALELAERVGHDGQRLVEGGVQQLLIGHVGRHLAQAVHVVGEADEPRLPPPLGEQLEGVSHHAGARHLAEGADVRQPRRPIARLEDDRLLGAALQLLQPGDEPARLLERPGPGFGEGRRDGGFGRWT